MKTNKYKKINRVNKINQGFSLTELIIVIVIMGILAAVLIPSLTKYIEKARDSAAVQEIAPYVTVLSTFNIEKAAGSYTKSFYDYCYDYNLSVEKIIAIDTITPNTSTVNTSVNINADSLPYYSIDGFLFYARNNRLVAYNHVEGATNVVNLNKRPIQTKDGGAGTEVIRYSVNSLSSFQELKNIIENSESGSENGLELDLSGILSGNAESSISIKTIITTKGLEYKYVAGTGFEVSGVGIATNEQTIYIPEFHEEEGIGRYPVVTIGERAFQNNNMISKVIISSNIKEIKKWAFNTCKNLAEVEIAEGLEIIRDNAFTNSSSLSSINIPSTVISIGKDNFKSTSIANSVNSDVIYIDKWAVGYTWSNNQLNSPSSIILEDGTVGMADSLFKSCAYILSIVIPDTVIYIGNLPFDGCTRLETVVLPFGLTNIQDKMFYMLTNLKQIKIPLTVETIGTNAFYNCTNLMTIVIPSSVTEIKTLAFQYCTNLESAILPSTVKVIGSKIFFQCTKLTIYTDASEPNPNWEATWNNVTNTNVFEVSWSFEIDSYNPTYLYVEDNGIKYAINTQIHEAYVLKQSSEIVSATIPSTIAYNQETYTVKSIFEGAFKNCTKLESIEIEASIEEIKMDTFYNCSSLKTIKLPPSVTKISKYSFSNCNSLVDISIPFNVEIIETYAFKDCSSIKTISFSNNDNISKLRKIEDYAFIQCIGLESITIPSSVKEIGENPFSGCIMLKSIKVDEGNERYTSKNNAIENNMIFAVDNCTLITGISTTIIPNNTRVIGADAFRNCQLLETVVLPSTVTTIESMAFYSCSNLVKIILPNSLEIIGTAAFSYCTKLSSIIIPDSVTVLKQSAFSECTQLTIFTTHSSKPEGWIKIDSVLPAHWNNSNRIVLWGCIFDNEGKLVSFTSIENISHEHNNKKELADPVFDGYEFLGWYEDSSMAGEPIDSDLLVNGVKTYYAKWEPKSDPSTEE